MELEYLVKSYLSALDDEQNAKSIFSEFLINVAQAKPADMADQVEALRQKHIADMISITADAEDFLERLFVWRDNETSHN